MDCSGTIYYLLNRAMNDSHTSLPRDADDMYSWLVKQGKLHHVKSNDLNSDDFNDLKPGDLLFWSGTYATDRAITHVMLYLGKTKDNKPLMFGSSDGRTYQNMKMRGVSVFDFMLPKTNDKATFMGYGCVPTLTC